jgi:hypothetical protein
MLKITPVLSRFPDVVIAWLSTSMNVNFAGVTLPFDSKLLHTHQLRRAASVGTSRQRIDKT